MAVLRISSLSEGSRNLEKSRKDSDGSIGLSRFLVLTAQAVKVAHRPARLLLCEPGLQYIRNLGRRHTQYQVRLNLNALETVAPEDLGRLPLHLQISNLFQLPQ